MTPGERRACTGFDHGDPVSRRRLIGIAGTVALSATFGRGCGLRPRSVFSSSVPTAPAEPPSAMWVGASSESPSDPAEAQRMWSETNASIGDGKLTYRRSFNPSIPAIGKEAWRKTDAPRQFYSVKPPQNDINGYLAGRYDTQLRAVAQALPAGAKFCFYHEPEDNMAGDTFRLVTAKTVDLVRSVNMGVGVWYVAMAYQWRTNTKGHLNDNAGWVDAARLADGVGLDIYASPDNPTQIADDPGFHRWWEEVKLSSGKQWGVIERGISADLGSRLRRSLLRVDGEFVRARGCSIFLYWNVEDKSRAKLTEPDELAEARRIAAIGRQA